MENRDMIFIIVAITVLLGWLYYNFFLKPKKFWKERGLTEVENTTLSSFWPVVFRRKPMPVYMEEIYNSVPNARYAAMYQFSKPFLLIRDPELVKLITVKDFDHFTDHKPFIDPDSDPVWGGSLMTLKGEQWKDMRSTLSATFTSSKMRMIFGLIKEVAENFVNYYEKQGKDVQEVELKDAFTRFTNDVIATSAFGVSVNSFENPDNEFYRMGKDATDFTKISLMLKFFGYTIFPALFKVFKMSLFGAGMTNFFKNLVEESIKVREEKNIVRPDMLNILLEAKKGSLKQDDENVIDTGFAVSQEDTESIYKGKKLKQITNADIVSQAVIFFIAGFESSSNLMCFATYELGVNQDIQDKLREEVNKTLEECNGDITYEALLKMKYMDMVVTETLRKWPVIIGTDRVCTKPYVIEPTLPNETPLEIRVGDALAIPTMGFHRDPNYFPDPTKFDPERFSDENKHNIVPYTFMPFGIGPRACIGNRFALLETKCVLFYLLSRFEIVPCDKTQIPLKLCKKSISMSAENGFWFGLKPIKKRE